MKNIVYVGRDGKWAQQALEAGFRVTARGLDDEHSRKLQARGCETVEDLREIWEKFEPPRIYLMDLETGAAVDEWIDSIYVFMEPGDCVVDLTVSYWGDTLRRYRRMRHRAIYYVDAAVIDPGQGEMLVLSGEKRARDFVEQPMTELMAPRRAWWIGESASAHYSASIVAAVTMAKAQIASETRQMLEAFPRPMEVGPLGDLIAGQGRQPDGRQAWVLDDAVNLEASIPVVAAACMSELAEKLDDCASAAPLKRVGGFVHPDDIL